MNPLEVAYCWQSILLAVFVYMTMHLVKALVFKDVEAMEPKKRYRVKRILLPALSPVVGALAAIVVPMRPDIIVAYVRDHHLGAGGYLVYAMWGGMVGQFSDYAYSKISKLLRDRNPSAGAGGDEPV